MGWFVLWVALSLIAGVIAANKGRSAVGFFFLAFLLSPIVGIVAAFAVKPNTAHIHEQRIADGDARRCPHCAEMVRPEARVCRHCGRDLTPSEASPTEEQWDRFVAALEKRNTNQSPPPK